LQVPLLRGARGVSFDFHPVKEAFILKISLNSFIVKNLLYPFVTNFKPNIEAINIKIKNTPKYAGSLKMKIQI